MLLENRNLVYKLVHFDGFNHERRENFVGMGILRNMNYYTLKFSIFKKKFVFFIKHIFNCYNFFLENK